MTNVDKTSNLVFSELRKAIGKAVNPHEFNCGWVKHPDFVKMVPTDGCTCGLDKLLQLAASAERQHEPSSEQIQHLLTCVEVELSHSRTFVTSREKMHAGGIEQFDMVLASVRAVNAALSQQGETSCLQEEK